MHIKHINVPLLPFILFGSYYLGHLLIGGEELIFSTKIDLEYIQGALQQYVIGSIILSLIVGFIFFILSYLFLSISSKLIQRK